MLDKALIPPLSHLIFKDKTEYITIYMLGSSSIHVVMHSVLSLKTRCDTNQPLRGRFKARIGHVSR
jgi:hypothetical protein